jgi:hypothetical protein
VKPAPTLSIRLPHPRSLALLGIVAASVAFAPLASAREHLRIAANGAAIDGFENWTSTGSWADIVNFKNANATRPVVDLVLELQALKAGSLDFDFELVRVPTYDLAKTEVIEGRAELAAETIWADEVAPHAGKLLATDPVIRDGEFLKGIYVLPSDEAHLKIASMDDLRACVCAVVSTWSLDVKCVEDLKLKGVVKTVSPEIAFLQVQKGAADFTLAEFSSSPDLHVELRGVKLVPVPQRTIAIRGSRAWVVSKMSPNAAAVFAALQAGTGSLRKSGAIERAYKESGFLNPRVSAWVRLN